MIVGGYNIDYRCDFHCDVRLALAMQKIEKVSNSVEMYWYSGECCSGNSYKASTIINYDSRVIILAISNLES